MSGENGRVILGICAMDKKTKAKPMQALIQRLPPDEFTVVMFGDEVRVCSRGARFANPCHHTTRVPPTQTHTCPSPQLLSRRVLTPRPVPLRSPL